MSRIVLRSILAMLMLAFALATCSPALAVNYVVDTLNDSSGGGNCSLRDAISAAEGHPESGSTCKTSGLGNDAINFAPGIGGGTITLQDFLPDIDRGLLSVTGPAAGIT